MKLAPPYITLANPDLPHQAVFLVVASKVHISCNCLRRRHGTYVSQDPIAEAPSLEISRKLYNDPTNHRIPFSKEDEAKW